MSWISKIFDFLSSIKLAVIVIVGLAVVSAVGTIYEARYDAEVAKKVVYGSIYMWGVLGLLAVNLIAVMIDRWPWKKKHIGFVLAHIGIITMLIGSFITHRYGIDGSMAFDIGESNQYITLPEQELAVYASFMDTRPTLLYRQNRDFYKNPPQKESFQISLGTQKLKVLKYYHYGVRQSEIVSSEDVADGPGIRFQLQNDKVNLSEWILRAKSKSFEAINLGPARVVLSDGTYQYTSGNEVILETTPKSPEIKYAIYTASKGGLVKSGRAKAGESVETGWMGLTLRFLRHLPRASERLWYEKREFPNKLTHPALQVEYEGKQYWLGLNSMLRLFDKDKAYLVSYGNKRISVGFKMQLTRFHVGTYQGTMRAASYESEVSVPGKGHVNISMNEPLQYNGYTFYQASFERDDAGQPVRSILSVNYDPGRGLKYLGSFLMVLGSVILFYFKRVLMKKTKQAKTPPMERPA